MSQLRILLAVTVAFGCIAVIQAGPSSLTIEPLPVDRCPAFLCAAVNTCPNGGVLITPSNNGCPGCPLCCLPLPCARPQCPDEEHQSTTLENGCPGCPVCKKKISPCPVVRCVEPDCPIEDRIPGFFPGRPDCRACDECRKVLTTTTTTTTEELCVLPGCLEPDCPEDEQVQEFVECRGKKLLACRRCRFPCPIPRCVNLNCPNGLMPGFFESDGRKCPGCPVCRPEERKIKQCESIACLAVVLECRDGQAPIRPTLEINGVKCLGCETCPKELTTTTEEPQFVECPQKKCVPLDCKNQEKTFFKFQGRRCEGCPRCARDTCPVLDCPKIHCRGRKSSRPTHKRVNGKRCPGCPRCVRRKRRPNSKH